MADILQMALQIAFFLKQKVTRYLIVDKSS